MLHIYDTWCTDTDMCGVTGTGIALQLSMDFRILYCEGVIKNKAL